MATVRNRQVEAFRAVMLTGSITEAAGLLFITQPAVTRLIQDFETLTGLKLFDRRPNRVTPTSEAVALYGEVERSFVGLDRIVQFARSLCSQTAGTIRIATMPAFASEVLPRFVSRFLSKRQDARISLEGFNSVSVVEAVASGEVDFGYTMSPVNRTGFKISRLGGVEVVVMPSTHRLMEKEVIYPQDLNGEHLIGSFGPRSGVDIVLAEVETVTYVETRLAHVACVMVAEGVGLSIVDPYTAAIFLSRGVGVRPFRPEVEVGISLITLQKRKLSPLAQTFLDDFNAYLLALRALTNPHLADRA